MNVLALDIATSVGWAQSNGTSGVLHLPTDDYGRTAEVFAQFLVARMFDPRLDMLVIETPTFTRVSDSAYRCSGLAWTAHHLAYLHDIPRREVRPTSWRKAVLGNGGLSRHAAKNEAIKWAKAAGHDPADDNEAEALCLLSYAMREWADAA